MDSCLLTPLRTIESSTKSIASVLVVILHASHDIITAFDTTKEGSHYRSQLISTVLPLLGSSGSQIRILSQIIMHRLHPEGYENSHNSNGSKDGSSDSSSSSSSSPPIFSNHFVLVTKYTYPSTCAHDRYRSVLLRSPSALRRAFKRSSICFFKENDSSLMILSTLSFWLYRI